VTGLVRALWCRLRRRHRLVGLVVGEAVIVVCPRCRTGVEAPLVAPVRPPAALPLTLEALALSGCRSRRPERARRPVCVPGDRERVRPDRRPVRSSTLPPGTVLVDPADAALLAWAIGEAVRSMRTTCRTVPTELQRLHGLLRATVAGGSDSAHAEPAPVMAASGQDEVTVAEAAVALARSPQRVRQLVAAGVLPARRVGQRALLLDADAVAAYVLRRNAA
jgi:excisionase family DNA binding protein